MFCPNCGSNVPDTERFCPTCGTAMGGENAAPAAPQAPAAKNDVVSLIKSKLPLIIGAVVAVVAVVFLWNLIFGGSVAAKYMKAYVKGDDKAMGKYSLSYGLKYHEAMMDELDAKEEDYWKSKEASDYKDYCEEQKENADDGRSDEFGSNWKVKAETIGSTKDLSKDEETLCESKLESLEELGLIDDVGDYDNFKKEWVLVSCKGEDGKEYEVVTVYMFKNGLSWKVLFAG